MPSTEGPPGSGQGPSLPDDKQERAAGIPVAGGKPACALGSGLTSAFGVTILLSHVDGEFSKGYLECDVTADSMQKQM